MKSQAIFVIAMALHCASCGHDEKQAATPPATPTPAQAPAEQRVEVSSVVAELLELATRASNMIPAEPHRKTRSRMQEQVAATCLELGAPDRALSIVEPIDSWRRGTGLADIAYYRAKNGQRDEAERLAKLAAKVAEDVVADPKEQEWRAARVRAKLVRVYQVLGDADQAAIFAEGLPDSEQLHVQRAKADQATLAQLDGQLKGVDHALANGNYEVISAALEFCVRLHARFYAEAERRAQLTARITRAAEKLPRQHAVSLHLQLATAALDNQDPKTAQDQLREARAILDFGRWAPEHKATLAAQIANRRARAGDKERARFEIDEALALVETEHAKIIDIDRADALYPLAEAYHALGDMVACQQTYLQALDEALVNPNSVPRAEDVVSICLSLAKLSITPDPNLRKRLTEAVGGLSHPW